MKEITLMWLKAWGLVALILLGIPTLGFAWFMISSGGVYDRSDHDPWQLKVIRSLEGWLHFMRGCALFIMGFATLGYTWFLFNRWEEPCFLKAWEKYKWSKKE